MQSCRVIGINRGSLEMRNIGKAVAARRHTDKLPIAASPRNDYAERSSPSSLFWILRRRLTLVLLTIAVIVGATTIWLAVTTPVYRASALLQLDQSISANAERSDKEAPPIREIEQQLDYSVRVQMEAVKSRSVARRVVADLQLYKIPEFNPKGYQPIAINAAAQAQPLKNGTAGVNTNQSVPAAAPDPLATVAPAVAESTIDQLLAHLNAEQVGTTNFIRVTAESINPAMAAKIANAVVQSYVAVSTEELATKNKRLIGVLSARTDELNERLKSAEFKVADFKRQNGIDSSFAEGAGAAQIQGAAAAVAVARGESAQASAIAARQRSAGSAESGLLTNLRNQESNLQSRLANLSTQYGARYPEVLSVSAELREVQGAIAAEAARASANIQSASDGASARAGQISSELGGLRAKARSQDMVSPELGSLEREVETSNSLYLSMLERVKELQTRAANPTPEALPVSNAIMPTSPSFPKPFQVLSVALVSAIILGIFLALIVDSFDNRLRSGEQIGRLTLLPTFAMIPQRGTIPKRLDVAGTALDTPNSVFAEAFRSAFLEIISHTSGLDSRMVVITSALPGEGKTSVSLGIAMSAMTQGMRAIVLDFDVRRRGLTKVLDLLDNTAGLDTYLMGKTSLEDSISYSTKGGGIASMTVCETPENPASLFDAEKLEALFKKLRSQFDFIVIDTPPIMAVRDAKILASYSDATVMTARWGMSTPETVRSVTRLLGNALIGVIITRVNYAKHAHYGYGDAVHYYSRYSSYYNEPDDILKSRLKKWLSTFRQKFSAA